MSSWTRNVAFQAIMPPLAHRNLGLNWRHGLPRSALIAAPFMFAQALTLFAAAPEETCPQAIAERPSRHAARRGARGAYCLPERLAVRSCRGEASA